MNKRIATAFSACVLALGVSSGVALAQQAPPAQSFSDAQLEKFVSASQKVAVISQEYTPKMQASKDDTSRQQVYQEADQKMVSAVRKEGMTVEEFNGINQAIQKDPTLAQRVQKMVK